MIIFAILCLLGCPMQAKATIDGFSVLNTNWGHSEYLCHPKYCHADLGGGFHAPPILLEGNMVAFRFPIPSRTSNSEHRGLQLSFSFYSEDHLASTILLTDKSYQKMFQLWESGAASNDSLPDAAALPRFWRDYSFENDEVSGVINRLIPFGLLDQEIGGDGDRPSELVMVLFRHGLSREDRSSAARVALTITAAYLTDLDLTKALGRCEFHPEAEHEPCRVAGSATLFRHEFVAIEIRPPPRPVTRGPPTIGSTGARLHFSFHATIPPERSVRGATIETSMPLFRSELVPWAAFRRISSGEMVDQDTGKHIELHYETTRTASGAFHASAYIPFISDSRESSQYFIFSFVNYNKVYFHYNCTVEFVFNEADRPPPTLLPTFYFAPPLRSCDTLSLKTPRPCANSLTDPLVRLSESDEAEMDLQMLLSYAADRRLPTDHEPASLTAHLLPGDEDSQDSLTHIPPTRPLEGIFMTFVGEGNPLLHVDFQRSRVFPVRTSLKALGGLCILSDARPRCLVPQSRLTPRGTSLLLAALVDRPATPAAPAALRYRLSLHATAKVQRSWIAGAALAYGFQGLALPASHARLTIELPHLHPEGAVEEEDLIVCLGYLGPKQPGFAHFLQPQRYNMTDVTVSAEVTLLPAHDERVRQHCSHPPSDLGLVSGEMEADPVEVAIQLEKLQLEAEGRSSAHLRLPSRAAQGQTTARDEEEEEGQGGEITALADKGKGKGGTVVPPTTSSATAGGGAAGGHPPTGHAGEGSGGTMDLSSLPHHVPHPGPEAEGEGRLVPEEGQGKAERQLGYRETEESIARERDPTYPLMRLPRHYGDLAGWALLGGFVLGAVLVGWVLGRRASKKELYDLRHKANAQRTTSGRELLRRLSNSFRMRGTSGAPDPPSSVQPPPSETPPVIYTPAPGEAERIESTSNNGSRPGSKRSLLKRISNSFKITRAPEEEEDRAGREGGSPELLPGGEFVDRSGSSISGRRLGDVQAKLRMRGGGGAADAHDRGVTTAYNPTILGSFSAPAPPPEFLFQVPGHLAIPGPPSQQQQQQQQPGTPSSAGVASLRTASLTHQGISPTSAAPLQPNGAVRNGPSFFVPPSQTAPLRGPPSLGALGTAEQRAQDLGFGPQRVTHAAIDQRNKRTSDPDVYGVMPSFPSDSHARPAAVSQADMMRRMRHSAHVPSSLHPPPSILPDLTGLVPPSPPSTSPHQAPSRAPDQQLSPPALPVTYKRPALRAGTGNGSPQGLGEPNKPRSFSVGYEGPQVPQPPGVSFALDVGLPTISESERTSMTLDNGPRVSGGAFQGGNRTVSLGGNRSITINILRSESSMGGDSARNSADSLPSPEVLRELMASTSRLSLHSVPEEAPGPSTAAAGAVGLPMVPSATGQSPTGHATVATVTAAGNVQRSGGSNTAGGGGGPGYKF